MEIMLSSAMMKCSMLVLVEIMLATLLVTLLIVVKRSIR